MDKYIHVKIPDELHRLLKVTAAQRSETVTDAITRLAWWYVDETDELLLDICEMAQSEDELAHVTLNRALSRFKPDAAREEE